LKKSKEPKRFEHTIKINNMMMLKTKRRKKPKPTGASFCKSIPRSRKSMNQKRRLGNKH
jgi:hypothetical protein